MKKSIIVPVDFSEVSNYAMEHAYNIASKMDRPMILIHIVSNKSQIDEKKIEIDKLAKDFKEKHTDIIINTVVKSGNLFKSIYQVALEQNTYLAVMGTHGSKTVKKAMKVVKKFTKIAFILVQAPPTSPTIKSVLVPLTTNQKARANFNWIRIVDRYFDIKVFLLYPVYKQDMKNKLIVRNLKFAEKILDKELISYEIVRSNNNEEFSDDVFNQIKDLDIDMLSLMSTNYKEMIKNIKTDKSMETYKSTPILCVNPRADIEKFGGLTG